MNNISEINNEEKIIKQWVSEVIEFSSQYNDSNQSAAQIIGQPKVYPEYGDRHGVWAQGQCNSEQFIVVKFEDPFYLTELNIYETFNAGAIVRIKSKNNDADEWVTVWESSSQEPEQIEQSRIFSPTLKNAAFKTDTIRLDVNCAKADSWCEIDAIEMVGSVLLPIDPIQTDEALTINLLKMLESEEFSDIKFEVQGKIINGHRNIFAARSTYFKNILCNLDPKDSMPVKIENITFDVFKALMFYLYSGTIDSNCSGETVCDLIRAGQVYNLLGWNGLDQVGVTFIKTIMCRENVIGILVNATKKEPYLDRVERQCFKFFAKNFNEILTHPEFKNLDRNILVKITQFYGKFFQKQA